jgi:hypothetical protein
MNTKIYHLDLNDKYFSTTKKKMKVKEDVLSTKIGHTIWTSKKKLNITIY